MYIHNDLRASSAAARPILDVEAEIDMLKVSHSLDDMFAKAFFKMMTAPRPLDEALRRHLWTQENPGRTPPAVAPDTSSTTNAVIDPTTHSNSGTGVENFDPNNDDDDLYYA